MVSGPTIVARITTRIKKLYFLFRARFVFRELHNRQTSSVKTARRFIGRSVGQRFSNYTQRYNRYLKLCNKI